jgi:MFS transporter, DHA1 family, multidrug resistance protein
MTLERRVLVWMCVLVAANQLGFGAMVPSLPLYAHSFGVPASLIGMAVAAYGLARFAGALPAGLILTTGQVMLADISTPDWRGARSR